MTKMKPLMELNEPFYCLNHAQSNEHSTLFVHFYPPEMLLKYKLMKGSESFPVTVKLLVNLEGKGFCSFVLVT